MPKSRQRRELHFSVTPWTSKKRKSSHASETEPTPCYEEVLLELHPRRKDENGDTPDSSLNQAVKRCEPSNSLGCVPKSQLDKGVASEWKKKPSTKSSDGSKEARHHWEDNDLIDSDNSLFREGASSDATIEPDVTGHLTGHFIKHGSTTTNFGIVGQQLLSKSDCMRDDDWKLLRLTFINFNPRRECTVFVEKKGGDAAVLAPVDPLRDNEIAGLSDEDKKLLQKGSRVKLWFDCCVVKCDGDAQCYVEQCHPKLVGKDVLVNMGEMRLEHLAAGFIEKCIDGDSFW